MRVSQMAGVIGAYILSLGLFAPIYSVGVGDYKINHAFFETEIGKIMLGVAALSMLIVLTKYCRVLWLTAIPSLAGIGWSFYQLQTQKQENLTGQLTQIEWGWAVLTMGALFLVIAAALPGSKKDVER